MLGINAVKIKENDLFEVKKINTTSNTAKTEKNAVVVMLSTVYIYYIEKKDDEWKVDQQHISKLKEQYEKERKGKKSSK